MVYSYHYHYTPKYYSTLQDSIASLCKTILPFSFKKRSLPSAEHMLSKLQSDNLKWQQDSFHQVLNLMGLHKEGILAETEVSAFRTHLLDTLIASPSEQEHPVILRDKLLFLQELLYAKCISEEDYHSSKRPLLQRLAVQGAQIEARDVIMARPKDTKESLEDEWSVIDLKDEKCLLNKESLNSKNKSDHGGGVKQFKGAASVFGFVSSHKHGKNGMEKHIFDSPSLSNKNEQQSEGGSILMEESGPLQPLKESSGQDKLKRKPFRSLFNREQVEGHGDPESEQQSEGGSILMEESGPLQPLKESSGQDKLKRKPFRSLFNREQVEGHGDPESDQRAGKSVKRQWGFDGFKKWKRNDSDDEIASEAYSASSQPCARTLGEGPDTKLIKKKLHSDGSPSDFFIDKVLGDKIKKELSRIQTELSSTNPNLKFSNDQMEAISTKIPVDKAELKNYFPKSWCDRYGDVVLDVVKKEFKEHVGEMENMRNIAREKHGNSRRWTSYEDDENIHPNLFANHNNSVRSSNINPFSHGYSKWN